MNNNIMNNDYDSFDYDAYINILEEYDDTYNNHPLTDINKYYDAMKASMIGSNWKSEHQKDLHNYWLKYKTNEGYIAIIDFSKFYDNIRHDKIKEFLYPLIDDTSKYVIDEIIDKFKIDVSYMSNEEYEKCMDSIFVSLDYFENVTDEMKTGNKYMYKSVDIGD